MITTTVFQSVYLGLHYVLIYAAFSLGIAAVSAFLYQVWVQYRHYSHHNATPDIDSYTTLDE